MWQNIDEFRWFKNRIVGDSEGGGRGNKKLVLGYLLVLEVITNTGTRVTVVRDIVT